MKINKHKLILMLSLGLALVSLTACQDSDVNTGFVGRQKAPVETRPDEEILPTLQIVEQGKASKMVLRSQTSSYLNEQKSALEIELTSSKVAFCQNEEPPLQTGEESLKIIIKAKDPKTTIAKGEFADNPDYQLTAIRKTASGETTLDSEQLKSFKITDINNAIVRGNLNVASPDLDISGEYFTAICQ